MPKLTTYVFTYLGFNEGDSAAVFLVRAGSQSSARSFVYQFCRMQEGGLSLYESWLEIKLEKGGNSSIEICTQPHLKQWMEDSNFQVVRIC